MRQSIIILILFGFTACSLFESKAEKTEKLVEQHLLQIDWSDVDDYPLFSDCDETVSKILQKKCFEEKMLLHLTADLKEFALNSETKLDDVIFLDFVVEKDGNIFLENIENKEIFGNQITDFNNRVENSLNSLPRIEPALKRFENRGVPVSAKFRIPIFINSK